LYDNHEKILVDPSEDEHKEQEQKEQEQKEKEAEKESDVPTKKKGKDKTSKRKDKSKTKDKDVDHEKTDEQREADSKKIEVVSPREPYYIARSLIGGSLTIPSAFHLTS